MSAHWPGQVQLGWEAGWLGTGCPWGSCWSSLGPDRPVHQQDPGEDPGAFLPSCQQSPWRRSRSPLGSKGTWAIPACRTQCGWARGVPGTPSHPRNLVTI